MDFFSPRLMNYEMIPYTWKEFIYHVGRARDQYSSAVAGLVAGGKERKGRQKNFFTPLDPVSSDANEAELITDFNKARKVHYQIHWRPEQDVVYWVHLRSAQSAGLEFWQTGSNAIVTYQSVPKECIVKVVSESGKREMFARQLTPREGPKVTRRENGFIGAPTLCACLGKLRRSCRYGTPPPFQQSCILPKVEFEHSVDLRVDGIPNDETYKDEQ